MYVCLRLLSMYVCMSLSNLQNLLVSEGVKFLTKNVQYLITNSIFWDLWGGGTSRSLARRQTCMYVCMFELQTYPKHVCMYVWSLKHVCACWNPQAFVYVCMYVCMYTSINIVSMCISFWGSRRGHDSGWEPLCWMGKKDDKTRGFETYTLEKQIINKKWRVNKSVCMFHLSRHNTGFSNIHT